MEKLSQGTSLIGKVSGFFSRSLSESLKFKKYLKNKPIQLIYSENKFKNVLNTFDKEKQSEILIVYIHSLTNPSNVNYHIMKKIINNPDLSMFINTNFKFYPILSNEKTLSDIKNFFGRRDVPCFLFFRWNIESELKLLRMINLKNRPTTDEVMEAMSDVLELGEEQKNNEEGRVREIQNKKKKIEELRKEHERKMNDLFNRQNRSQNNNNQYFFYFIF